MTFALEQLPWLPAPPADFSEQLSRIREMEREPAIAALREIATSALNANQLTTVARTAAALKVNGEPLSLLRPLQIGVVGDTTTSFLVPAITATGFRHGLDLTVIEAPFNQVTQEALSPESTIARARPDIVLLLVSLATLNLEGTPDADESEAAVSAALAHTVALRDALRNNTGATVIVPTLVRPSDNLFGNLEVSLPGSLAWSIDRYNARLAEWIANEPDHLLDLASLASSVGLVSWHDEKLWHLAKLPFADRFVPLFADHVARLLAAHTGLSRRALIVDLDNTVWGGVIGDDGLEGIVIGQGDPVGEAYLAFQQALRRLKGRGIVLNVCSKNDEALAREPFRRHPDMLLSEQDFAVFQANWLAKPGNIRAIADKLALGLESLVFVDDNPVERAHVRQELPMVAVPEMPTDPALFAPTLMAAGYFETVAVSREDAERASYYRANAQRAELMEHIGSMEEFLCSLDMTSQFCAADDLSMKRITQLINKSNQFNLTTRRHDENTVRSFIEMPGHSVVSVRLCDKFGDNGIVSALHLAPHGERLDIETWVMSCRVLGRSLEETILDVLVKMARAQGAKGLRGCYLPTRRNSLVSTLYDRLGFELAAQDEAASEWILDLDDYVAPALPIEVEIDDRLIG